MYAQYPERLARRSPPEVEKMKPLYIFDTDREARWWSTRSNELWVCRPYHNTYGTASDRVVLVYPFGGDDAIPENVIRDARLRVVVGGRLLHVDYYGVPFKCERF